MSECKPIPKLKTLGVLTQDLRVAQHRLAYVLRTRPHIRPTATAGRFRLYDREAVAMIRYELNAMDARRCRKAVPLA